MTPTRDTNTRRLVADGGQPRTRKSSSTHAKGVTTREVDGEDVEMLRVPISSTRADRENDEFSKSALEEMAEQIRDEKPLAFQNHGLAGSWMDAIPYDQAETIGTHHDADVVEADDGEHELVSYINPDGTHPEGERMLKQVRDEKQAIKFSVGFGIRGYEEKEDDAGNTVGRVFTDVDLMEDSKVGIPANPDASAPVDGKNSTEDLPGYQMHPMVQMMQSMQAGETGASAAVKSQTPGDTEDSHEEKWESLRSDVDALAESVDELAERLDTGTDATKEECDVDTDCPEGEVCLEGECVPEDEVDDDEDEESSTSELDELREEVADIRDELDKGLGSPESTDTETRDTDPTRDTEEPDAENKESEGERERTQTATELARGN